jgi:UDP-N-acetylmuramoyl-tripeptide--D-alanyl-D-alanine ligase
MNLTQLKQLGTFFNKKIEEDTLMTGVAVDSRLVIKGNVFFALSGSNVDGHDFLGQAKAAGASCLVVNENYKGPNFDLPMIFVNDPLKSLQDLSAFVLSKRKTKIVAITGSVGKTTTKDFLNILLKEKYRVSKTPGNANSQIGVPLTILNHTDGNEDILILEMGMNEPHQLARLVEIAPPDISILTHVALTHASNFNSLSDIAYEKAEIFKHPRTKIGIINHDIENFHEIAKIGTCRKVSFSLVSEAANFFFNDFTIHNLDFPSFKLNRSLHPFFGKHHYQNLCAAISCARQLDVSFEEIENAIQNLELPERRFEIVEKQGIIFVNDSYNASEISVKAALESLPEPKKHGKKIAVIGEMLELGKFSKFCHQNVADHALKHVDTMFLLGKECEPIFDRWNENQKPVEMFLDRSLLLKSLKLQLKCSDVVLLKGSRANQLWKILEEF